MKHLAIIMDSFSPLTKQKATKMKDIFFIPMKVIVNGKEYLDGNGDFSSEELMKIVNEGKDVKTSQPSIDTVSKLYKKLSKEYDNIIHLSIGSALSGTYQTVSMLSNDYKNIFVIPNFLVGDSFFELSNYLLKKAETTPIEELISFATTYGQELPTYVVPKNNDAIIRGGRIGKTTSFLLQKLKAVPVLAYESADKIKRKMVKRSGKKAIKYAIEKMEQILHQEQKEYPKSKYVWQICHTIDLEQLDIALAILKNKGYKEFNIILTSSVINAHTGDGAISIGLIRKLEK